VIEGCGLGQLIRVNDALLEVVPGDNGLDCGVRIAIGLLGIQQGMADF
jgi:hypothetical protein